MKLRQSHMARLNSFLAMAPIAAAPFPVVAKLVGLGHSGHATGANSVQFAGYLRPQAGPTCFFWEKSFLFFF